MTETVYSREQIDEWLTKLDQLAEKPRTRFTKKQVVEAMIENIEKALTTHPYDEVAESLKGWGLDISPGSLKQYVNAYRRAHASGSSTKARKKRSGTRQESAAKKPAKSKAKRKAVKDVSADDAKAKKVTRERLAEPDFDVDKEFNL